jgi:hypothetical protein
MLGAVPIIIDPIFSGLAWTLIFGIFASTLFTLFVIPVAYWLLYANKPGHGMPVSALDQEEPVVLVQPDVSSHNGKGVRGPINRLPRYANAEIALVLNEHVTNGEGI